MSTTTNLPIHEVILKIMYDANREKPIGLTAEDILWKIDNPEITEIYLQQVMEWLVRQKKVELYLGKYTLDRYEFLEQRAKSQEEGSAKSGKETFYLKPSGGRKIKNLKSKILFFIGIGALGYITYLCYTMERTHQIPTQQTPPTAVVYTQSPLKKLFLPYNQEATEGKEINRKIEDIAYLFSSQNSNNNTIQQEITKLYKLTDSLQRQQQHQLNILQKQLDKNIDENINYTNEILYKIVLCNVIFMLLILIAFFRGKF